MTTHHDGRVPPFGHPRINALLATPLGLTRPDTSFIGSWYQGIHHAPLDTYTHDAPTSLRPGTPHDTPSPPQGSPGRRTTTQATLGAPSMALYSHHYVLDARIHYPVLKHPPEPQPPHPPTHGRKGRTGPGQQETNNPLTYETPREGGPRSIQGRVVFSGPNSVPPDPPGRPRCPGGRRNQQESRGCLRCFHP